jgi:hypothetical protein
VEGQDLMGGWQAIELDNLRIHSLLIKDFS